MSRHLTALLGRDPRHGQIAAVGALVMAGAVWFGFEMPWWRPVAALAAALATQWIGSRVIRLPFDWRSPVITALSLTLLLRTGGWELTAFAAAIAIGSKFVLRFGGRHIWNPAALAIVLVTSLSPNAWISTGQWGVGGWIAVFAVGAGLVVTRRAGRAEVPFLFLTAWAALSLGRAWWLGDPWAVPVHQLGSGALLVFAFFMISDPMTQPWHRGARVAWIVAVAALGFWMQHSWVVTAGPLWGLALLAPLVPILDRIFPAPRKTWVEALVPEPSRISERKGVTA
jgi:Na+-transporting NADH:ubiquinone oxidoreductase subunit NqrB